MAKTVVKLDSARTKRERSEKKARTRRVRNLSRVKRARFESAVGIGFDFDADTYLADFDKRMAERNEQAGRDRERRKAQYRDTIIRLAKMWDCSFDEMERCLDQRVNDSSHIHDHVEAMIDVESDGAAEALVYDEPNYWRGIAAQAIEMAEAIEAGEAGWGVTWGCEPQFYLDQRWDPPARGTT